jgi:hypothetical protein
MKLHKISIAMKTGYCISNLCLSNILQNKTITLNYSDFQDARFPRQQTLDNCEVQQLYKLPAINQVVCKWY